MPEHRVVKCGDDCYCIAIIWDGDEWCSKLPEWWLEFAEGCNRCARVTWLATLAYNGHRLAMKLVEQLCGNGFVVVDGWVAKWEGHKVCLYPWPKMMFSKRFKSVKEHARETSYA